MGSGLRKAAVGARALGGDLRNRKRRARIKAGQAKARLQGRDLGPPATAGDHVWDPSARRELLHLPHTASTDEICTALTRWGAVVIDDLVDPEVMDRIKAEMAPHIDRTRFGRDDYEGRRTTRTGGLLARSESTRELVQHPLVLAAVERMLSASPTFQINLTQVISVNPGEPAQKIHRDHWTFGDFPWPAGHEVQCSTMWALDDFTAANGATRVIPGSNHAEDRLRFKQRDTIPAEMTKGSVLLYTGSVYHGGGANTSDQNRAGLNLTYIVGWLRQEENQYLSMPLEMAATLSPELQRLMGYQECGVSLGYVDDCRDPIEVLELDGV